MQHNMFLSLTPPQQAQQHQQQQQDYQMNHNNNGAMLPPFSFHPIPQQYHQQQQQQLHTNPFLLDGFSLDAPALHEHQPEETVRHNTTIAAARANKKRKATAEEEETSSVAGTTEEYHQQIDIAGDHHQQQQEQEKQPKKKQRKGKSLFVTIDRQFSGMTQVGPTGHISPVLALLQETNGTANNNNNNNKQHLSHLLSIPCLTHSISDSSSASASSVGGLQSRSMSTSPSVLGESSSESLLSKSERLALKKQKKLLKQQRLERSIAEIQMKLEMITQQELYAKEQEEQQKVAVVGGFLNMDMSEDNTPASTVNTNLPPLSPLDLAAAAAGSVVGKSMSSTSTMMIQQNDSPLSVARTIMAGGEESSIAGTPVILSSSSSSSSSSSAMNLLQAYYQEKHVALSNVQKVMKEQVMMNPIMMENQFIEYMLSSESPSPSSSPCAPLSMSQLTALQQMMREDSFTNACSSLSSSPSLESELEESMAEFNTALMNQAKQQEKIVQQMVHSARVGVC